MCFWLGSNENTWCMNECVWALIRSHLFARSYFHKWIAYNLIKKRHFPMNGWMDDGKNERTYGCTIWMGLHHPNAYCRLGPDMVDFCAVTHNHPWTMMIHSLTIDDGQLRLHRLANSTLRCTRSLHSRIETVQKHPIIQIITICLSSPPLRQPTTLPTR